MTIAPTVVPTPSRSTLRALALGSAAALPATEGLIAERWLIVHQDGGDVLASANTPERAREALADSWVETWGSEPEAEFARLCEADAEFCALVQVGVAGSRVGALNGWTRACSPGRDAPIGAGEQSDVVTAVRLAAGRSGGATAPARDAAEEDEHARRCRAVMAVMNGSGQQLVAIEEALAAFVANGSR